jgi:predicted nucleic acid-binding protein
MSAARRYWDSSVFLAWLLPEPDRAAECRPLIRAAQKGEILIVTSALTLTEVIKLKDHPPLKDEQEKKIHSFFQNDYISVRNVDRFVAERARRLIWEHGVKPKDATHVATALRWRIPVLDTYDGDDLIPLDGKLGEPPLRIGKPFIPHEMELPFMSKD